MWRRARGADLLENWVPFLVDTVLGAPLVISNSALCQFSSSSTYHHLNRMTVASHALAAIDPKEMLEQLTYEEKVTLLAGHDMWHTYPIPRLGIPRVRVRMCSIRISRLGADRKMSDGPNGIRGTSWLNSAPSACFPCATGTASTFDTDLLFRIGQALGNEARARATHCILGPTTNTQRDPRGGRGFESFSEGKGVTAD